MMEVTVRRLKFTPKCTMGEQSINGAVICKSLEDLDRGLSSDMLLDELGHKKVWGGTAIPTGRYKLEKLFWAAHNKFYPHLLNVPGYDGVLMHGGITDRDTEGCILYGTAFSADDYMVGQPQARELLITPILAAIDKGEEVWLTVDRDEVEWDLFNQAQSV